MVDTIVISELGYTFRKEVPHVVLCVVSLEAGKAVREDYWFGDGQLAIQPTLAWLMHEYAVPDGWFQPTLRPVLVEKTPLPMRKIPYPLDFG